jgi:hypothetical protein
MRTISWGGHKSFMIFIDDLHKGLGVHNAEQIRNVCQVQVVES